MTKQISQAAALALSHRPHYYRRESAAAAVLFQYSAPRRITLTRCSHLMWPLPYYIYAMRWLAGCVERSARSSRFLGNKRRKLASRCSSHSLNQTAKWKWLRKKQARGKSKIVYVLFAISRVLNLKQSPLLKQSIRLLTKERIILSFDTKILIIFGPTQEMGRFLTNIF